MPAIARPVVHTKSRAPIPWAIATALSGVADAAMLGEAVALVQTEKKRNPALVAWLIDAQGVTSIDGSAKIQLFLKLMEVRRLGIQTAGIVIPVVDADDLKKIQSQLPSNARIFVTMRDAQAWFDASCPR